MYYNPDQNKIDALIRRNKMLLLSDWTQMPDVNLSPELKAAWATYRQALRDITKQESFPDIQWPLSPASPDFVL